MLSLKDFSEQSGGTSTWFARGPASPAPDWNEFQSPIRSFPDVPPMQGLAPAGPNGFPPQSNPAGTWQIVPPIPGS